MDKDIKKIIAYSVPVIALGIGTFLGLNKDQTDTLQTALNGILTSGIVIYGLVGVALSHHKKEKKKK